MENNIFEELKQLDDLSELRGRVEDRYKPIVDAKIAYRLQKLHKSRKQKVDKTILRKTAERLR